MFKAYLSTIYLYYAYRRPLLQYNILHLCNPKTYFLINEIKKIPYNIPMNIYG